MDKKEILGIPRQKMPEQDPVERIGNMKEVPYGYTAEMAVTEAKRCLQCGKNAPCVRNCPVSIDIPSVMAFVAEGDFESAYQKIKENNLLPGICGRVCPQQDQCQSECTVGKIKKNKNCSVGIGSIERFLADWARANDKEKVASSEKKNGWKVAIIGSGPAGLTAAGALAKEGTEVHVFEALHTPGGVLVYGIPEFRLPQEIIDHEVSNLKKLGVKIHCNRIVGQSITMTEMLDEYDSVFIGSGAGLPIFMNIRGENSLGVYSANEYLTRINLMKAYKKQSQTPIYTPESLVVIGGGNVAVDSARTALRLGVKDVKLVYRRGEAEIPARAEEREHAKEEGVKFHFLTNIKEILQDEKGWVTGIRVVDMKLGDPDQYGRLKPVEVAGSDKIIKAKSVIMAIGNRPNPLVKKSFPEIETNDKGGIKTDPETLETSVKGVFAGGDIVLGAATVIKAMEHGKRAAKYISKYLHSL